MLGLIHRTDGDDDDPSRVDHRQVLAGGLPRVTVTEA